MSKMNIKVMGGGCSKCETLLHNTKEAVKATGIDAEVEYITDFTVKTSITSRAGPNPKEV